MPTRKGVGSGSGSIQIIMDPDPGGLVTNGSNEFGSGILPATIQCFPLVSLNNVFLNKTNLDLQCPKTCDQRLFDGDERRRGFGYF